MYSSFMITILLFAADIILSVRKIGEKYGSNESYLLLMTYIC
ncbi:hypothetical protein BACI348_42031 [Bacillus altitudinis]|uniref:Uncharacterized protein n=1 Tax=Bacillus altitudinis TaxID=293387 RepID=A0A653UX20_BACAB|nr:hypothetical protein BACI9J_20287 [Bacillus altitudinis]VXB98418.1 hypothetical protein BACI348_42031 [Bacillus altitudinis]